MIARIVTVGHSTLPLDAFLELLVRHQVAALADVRRLRGSRKFPHFDEERLAPALRRAGIEYAPVPALSGRRPKQQVHWRDPCWRNASFRNYADYMLTAEFRSGIRDLLALGRGRRVAVMCAEAVPWRCHRSLIADWLVVNAHRRVDELPSGKPHKLSACARVVRGRLSYDLA